MPIIVVKCPTAADAIAAKADADGGALWGVSLGTTSIAETKDSTLGIQATQTRCNKLGASAPGGWWASAVFNEAPWDGLPPENQASFLLGKMDS